MSRRLLFDIWKKYPSTAGTVDIRSLGHLTNIDKDILKAVERFESVNAVSAYRQQALLSTPLRQQDRFQRVLFPEDYLEERTTGFGIFKLLTKKQAKLKAYAAFQDTKKAKKNMQQKKKK
eukprot:comp25630_c0_seq1/m.47015 comp25630_c0_seq1/g.47015  ORF comp25630_c0_seq1/g.47015 comp25630_c0_seq1/m.47015 type:complete len:120 (-) comp25630_c0_seq1:367-726(-)